MTMDTVNLKNMLQTSYNRYAARRDQLVKDDWKVTERNVFMEHLNVREAKSILEIGAGTGQDSVFFVENGLQTIATDMSDEMVRLCREKNLEAYQMDFYSLNFPHESFDAVWSLNCLLHVPKQDLSGVFEGIRDVLTSGGLFYLGVYGGKDSEGIWQEDTYEPKRFFSFHTDESIQKAVGSYFNVVYFRAVDYGNESLHFQSMILQKPFT